VEREIDDRPAWEQALSPEDDAVWEAWLWLSDLQEHEADQPWADHRILRSYCCVCKMPKFPIRSSGRCAACEKYWQRHSSDRPFDLIFKAIGRWVKTQGPIAWSDWIHRTGEIEGLH
jgi:hypothetical protein